MDFISGLLLGLSTGTACLAYCGPVLIPYLLAESRGVSGNFRFMGLFLLGRLAAYMIVGVAAGVAGRFFLESIPVKGIVVAVVYMLLAIMMISYGVFRFKEVCVGKVKHRYKSVMYERYPWLIPVVGGVLTGVNICPPFLLAFMQAANGEGIAGGVLFFLLFFVGTAVYFIPLPFIGVLKQKQIFPIVGKFAAIIAGSIYLYKGLLTIILL